MKYSIVIILDHPRPEIVGTVQRLSQLLSSNEKEHEFVLVANGIVTSHLDQLPFEEIREVDIKLIQFTKHVTKGTGLSGALKHCDGEAIITCAPYRQFPNEEIISLINSFEQGVDLVIPWRQERVDPRINQLQSQLFNWLVKWTTKLEFNDLSCPLRIIRKDILSTFHLYGDLYRFLPIMVAQRGYKVIEKPCRHLEEEGEIGFYNPSMYFGRLIDFLTFHFDLFSSRKPLRYFGKRALFFLIPGAFLILLLVLGSVLGLLQIGNSPWLILALILLLIGNMTWSVGLLGELITFAMGRNRKEYLVEKVVGE